MQEGKTTRVLGQANYIRDTLKDDVNQHVMYFNSKFNNLTQLVFSTLISLPELFTNNLL